MVLCDDAHIQSLNAEWRQNDAPTDVLSFPMGDDAPPGYPARMLGDLVISLDTATLQATDAGWGIGKSLNIIQNDAPISIKYIVIDLTWLAEPDMQADTLLLTRHGP